jgi:uncharacterized protein YhhL (DUF1145 family)
MNSDALRHGKTALNVLWVVLALSFVLPTGGIVTLMRGAFLVMLAAHALEFVLFGRTLARLGGSMGHHFVQVLLYGFFHIQLAKLEAAGPAAAD